MTPDPVNVAALARAANPVRPAGELVACVIVPADTAPPDAQIKQRSTCPIVGVVDNDATGRCGTSAPPLVSFCRPEIDPHVALSVPSNPVRKSNKVPSDVFISLVVGAGDLVPFRIVFSTAVSCAIASPHKKGPPKRALFGK